MRKGLISMGKYAEGEIIGKKDKRRTTCALCFYWFRKFHEKIFKYIDVIISDRLHQLHDPKLYS